jgi:hypothetical protein
MLKLFRHDKSLFTSLEAVMALGETGVKESAPFILDLFIKTQNVHLKDACMRALGKTRNPEVVPELIKILSKETRHGYKTTLIRNIGFIGGPAAAEHLLKMLTTNTSSSTEQYLVKALGRIGNSSAIDALINIMHTNSNSCTSSDWALGLSQFPGDKVENALKGARENGNETAAIILAYRHGGKDLDKALKMVIKTGYYPLIHYADARWGNAEAFKHVITGYIFYDELAFKFHKEVCSMLPEGFPRVPADYNHNMLIKHGKEALEWYEKNKHRLAWDTGKKRYYLKPEAGK